MKKCFFLIAFLCPLFVWAQKNQKLTPTTATPADIRFSKKRDVLAKKSLIDGLTFDNIGPTIMSGRVVDLDVNPNDPKEFYAAFASGGLWYTKDNGQNFTPLFQAENVITIGDIAVDWATNTIWIGSGENNSSRSSYAGNGMYKSTDGGKTWIFSGLPDSQHIGRIILHPTDKNVLWVGVLGHLYSDNEERGVFKTIDGGKTWKKTLFLSPKVGVVDLAIHPQNPNMLVAATWERTRRAWDFTEAGIGSGLFKSADGGATWQKIVGGGFPEGKDIGRIGIAISESNPETIFVVMDNQEKIPPTEKEHSPLEYLTMSDMKKISQEEFMSISEDVLNNFLDENGYPAHINAKKVFELIKKGEIKHTALLDYLGNANDNLFNAKIKGCELYRSDDFGKTWKKTHQKSIDDLFYTYGYYFGQVRVHPKNPNKVYLLGVPIIVSNDGGASFEGINGENVHLDHHALWLNPNDEKHLINGNDGGINISYNGGKLWQKCNSFPVGQFYAVNVDMATPYRVYGGLQDNGVWFGVPQKEGAEWLQTGEYAYKELIGGDGMQIMIDSRDNQTVYTGYQFGTYYRINKEKGDFKYIVPKHKLGEKPFRFNWQTPIWLSKHNQDVLYLGSNRFHRSLNQGDDWETLSGDLTKGGKAGDIPYGTISSMMESPLKFGLLYVGTDDGLVHITHDGGNTWKKISDKLPQDLWVSRVIASTHKLGRVYVSLNGYRFDNFESYLYVSEDFGENWTRLGTDLPFEPVNVVKEDPKNDNLLYLGTDNGLYLSLDRGKNFMYVSALPAVAVHDLVVHPRDGDLIVGTHGRSLYKTSVAKLQEINAEIQAKDLFVFDLEDNTYRANWGKSGWNKWFAAEPMTTNWAFWSKTVGNLEIQIKSEKGTVIKKMTVPVTAGINFVKYDFTIDEAAIVEFQKELNDKRTAENQKAVVIEAADNGKFYLRASTFTVDFVLNGKTETKTWKLKTPEKRKR